MVDDRYKITELKWKFYPKVYGIDDRKYGIDFVSLNFHNPNPYFLNIDCGKTNENDLKNLKVKKGENSISLSFNNRIFSCNYFALKMDSFLRKYLKSEKNDYFMNIPWEERKNYNWELTQIDHCIITEKEIEKFCSLPDGTTVILVREQKEQFKYNQIRYEGRFLLEGEKEKHMNKMENRYNLMISNVINVYNENNK